MSDDEPVSMPLGGVSASWAFSSTNVVYNHSLTCATGPQFALCAGHGTTMTPLYDRPYVFALDPSTGHMLWNTRTYLSDQGGAPLIDANGNSYLSDSDYLASFDSQGNLRWRVANPAGGRLNSFNLTQDGYLVGQGPLGPLVVVDPTSGAIAGQLLLTDTVDGIQGFYATNNTVAVVGNRVYTVTQFCPMLGCTPPSGTISAGRLYAIDVVDGRPQVAWYWAFEGGSTASPLAVAGPTATTLYFDGKGLNELAPHRPWLFAVQDAGSTANLAWSVDLNALNGARWGPPASPAHDPRGGVWIWTGQGDSRLFRFNESSGALLQTIDVSDLIGSPGYAPTSSMSTVTNAGRPVMILGIHSTSDSQAPVYIVAIDLTNGQLVWQWLGGGINTGVFAGQFPVAMTPSGPVIISPREDGRLFGLRPNNNTPGATPTRSPDATPTPTATTPPSKTPMATSTSLATATPTSATMLAVSPLTTWPAQRVTVTGLAFAPGEAVDIYWGNIDAPALATATASGTGSFVTSLVAPQVISGTYAVIAVGHSGHHASTRLQIKAGLALTPASGLPGTTVRVVGSGFQGGEAVAVWWDTPTVLVGKTTASATGSFSGTTALTFTVPAQALAGQGIVTAIGQSSGISSHEAFTVRH
jgi:hypothetical protein